MTISNREVTADRLRSLLSYHEDGTLRWRESWNAQTRAGQIAGSLNTTGYRRIRIDGVRYPAHRLVWLYHHGNHPEDQLDHINRNRDDNRIINLRECNNSQNSRYWRETNRTRAL